MIYIRILSRHVLALAVFAGLTVTVGFGQQMQQKQQPQVNPQSTNPYPQDSGLTKEKQPAGGGGPDLSAAKKVEQAPDVEGRLKAATDFVKHYPKSTYMKQVATLVAVKIDEVQDGPQKITYAQTYLGLFKDPAETDIIEPILLDGYVKANRLDDAFQRAAADVQRNPDDVQLLTKMAVVAYNECKKRDTKYVTQGLDWGSKAITLIEADKRPASLNDQQWADYKTRLLADLYQATGFFNLMGGNEAEATSRLEKSIAVNPDDPFTYVLIGSITEKQYEALASKYKTMSAGPAQDEMLKQALAQLDKVIDYYAHGVGLAEGNPTYQALHDQVMQALVTYYKFRHKSTDGLQAMIDKYKKTPPGK